MFSHLFYLNRVLLSRAHTDDVTGRTYILGVETKPVSSELAPLSAFAFPSKALLTPRRRDSVVAYSWGSLPPTIKELCLSLY